MIPLISAGGSKFQTTMTKQASTPGENNHSAPVFFCYSSMCRTHCMCFGCANKHACIFLGGGMHFLLTAIYLCIQAAFVPLCPYRLMSGLHAHGA